MYTVRSTLAHPYAYIDRTRVFVLSGAIVYVTFETVHNQIKLVQALTLCRTYTRNRNEGRAQLTAVRHTLS